MPQNLSDAERQASNCGLYISKLQALLAEIEPPSEKYKMLLSLCDAQKQARNCGLDIPKLEALLAEIEPLSEKYKIIFYLAATGLFSADDLAEMFNHSSGKNLNADFNKNLGSHLKLYLDLDDSDRLGITSLRRILFKKGYLVDINDDELVRVLPTRYAENSQLEQSFTVRHN
ncbi:MAG: hypothetical protein GPI90_01015 [Microcystis aeruginosa K13-05]|jgi:hypothetical protein|uniref:hypothetical protein n=1 Tax=Microcystis TaxID=1125 RepID=UPI001680F6AB|nr:MULTISPECIES: hypothetical protein [Microcystis]NCR78622.1 hypothetical protein [Microcystis aeruginosa K13-10]NCR83305.1 hypothetical protein [Microcystis aeruginosa K13-05]MBD2115634.1 hypothetical protein [Microcystis wesenbergii FACHB-1339]MCZ8040104.1 hypothetical protein [Microcystis sp. LE17-20A]MCZ8048088.1 hypothetical protein [Microcystis sp. LE19-41.2A]